MKNKKHRAASNKISILYILTILGLGISFFIDKSLIILVTSNRINFLDNIILWITNAGSTLVVLFFMTTLFLWEEKKQRWILPLWTSLLVTLGIVYFLKLTLARPRPYETLQILHFARETTLSFPSAHAAVAFSAIPLLDREFPKLKSFWILFAVLVSFSRIYIGVHYLSDVIAGALIGGTISVFMVHIEEKHKIAKWIISNFKEKLSI